MLMILVTGGTGLVGMHLLLALTQENKPVRATFRSLEKVNEVDAFFAFAKAEKQFKTIDWIEADITDVPSLEPVFKDITHVYHCAALISFDPYDFQKLLKVNVEGTANIVNLCLAHQIQKLCHLSSVSALSKLPNNPITEDNIWDANEANSVYAISKYGAEMEVWRGTQEGLDAIIFNPVIILGEGDYTKGSGTLCDYALKQKRFYPKGSNGFIDVKDVVNLMIQGLHSSITKERYILVGENTSYKDILERMALQFSKKPPKKPLSNSLLKLVITGDWLLGILTRKRKITHISAASIQGEKTYSSEKAKQQLSYTPTPITDTLERIQHHITTKSL
ncbi:NAD-dependent epimerase [Dokdonia pacifica]|uniref:Nucleoside-diphosphate-sugar epimerase n=2 Tax=Dokdonia pacifica TaxID=1627892 RepID=A0A238VZ19_9FLAO|nr:NAD-dependent epimerase [Dokdonia pacifica]SNR39421.1 Nucleoside-diphosphate-sugar epimerase [Dokdonia pacifica]